MKRYTDDRGIHAETLEHFGLYEVDGSVAIPYGEATKFRRGWDPGERKFWWGDGKRACLFNLEEACRPTVILCESESDCMRLWQEIPDHEKVGVVSISGADGFGGDAARLLSGRRVFAALDNDEDYIVVSNVNAAFTRMRAAIPGIKRIQLPAGTKDICEFFKGYNFEAFRHLVDEAETAVPKSRFTPLNLNGTPPATDWLAQGLVARGDVHLLFGEPAVGKSWITLDLAVAVAEGRSHWMGFPIIGGAGRVLYVDEENPADVVLQRLRLLGLTSGSTNLRFLHHPGIRLDRNPHEFLEEVRAYEPKLIVLDSLTRLHTEDENNAGAISKLFNDGLIPLAHGTNAAVIVIHHANKTDSNNSYKRQRGSGDITGAADTSIDILAGDTDSFIVKIAKSRRVPIGHAANVKRVFTEGRVELKQMSAPF